MNEDSLAEVQALCFAYPTVRLGEVCETDHILEPAESRAVAEEICENWNKFQSAAAERWYECRPEVKVSWGEDEATLDTSQVTPLVRFPTMELHQETHRYTARLNLTVCATGKNSKVWCRIGLSQIGDSPADHLDRFTAREFWRRGVRMCRDVTAEVADRYRDVLYSRNLVTRFERNYSIVAQVVAADHPSLRKLFEEIRLANMTTMQQLLMNDHWMELLLPFFGIADLDAEKAIAVAERRVEGEKWEVQLATDYAAIYHSSVTEDVVRYSGLVCSTERDAVTARHAIDRLHEELGLRSTKNVVLDLAPLY